MENPFKKKAPGELFYPNCQGKSEDGILVCKPKIEISGKIFTSERPVQIKLDQGERAYILDDGGAPDFLIEKLLKDIEKKRLK